MALAAKWQGRPAVEERCKNWSTFASSELHATLARVYSTEIQSQLETWKQISLLVASTSTERHLKSVQRHWRHRPRDGLGLVHIADSRTLKASMESMLWYIV